MKYYAIKLLTTLGGVVTVCYRDDENRHEFIDKIRSKYGTFIQLETNFFDENPILNTVYELEEGESVDVKPFLTTMNVYKDKNDVLVITSTVEGVQTCICKMYEFMLANRSNNYSLLNWK